MQIKDLIKNLKKKYNLETEIRLCSCGKDFVIENKIVTLEELLNP